MIQRLQHLMKSHHLAYDDKAGACDVFGKARNGDSFQAAVERGHVAVVGGLEYGEGRFGILSPGQKILGDERRIFQPHIENQRPGNFSVDGKVFVAICPVAGNKGYGSGRLPLRHGNACHGRYGDAGGDPGDHLKGYGPLGKIKSLFAAATEDERIAAF